MADIQYVGEHLLPKQIGQASIILAFVAGLLATAAYFFATRNSDKEQYTNWRNIGRAAFAAHGLGIFVVIGAIFYVMVQQYYEYEYVWAHVSEDLPFQYIFSAFWEGQEGSFLLWLFWHVVLGMVLIVGAKRWEPPVMAILSIVQVFIVSMILGLYLGFGEEAVRIGSNPLMLLRDTMDAPIFRQADYVQLIQGQGLNPLLQNYWMTIHPPTLFLGFASTTIPFAFALAGLWTGEHKKWLRPALPWALFSGAILGIGILMGAAWAYEALTFGGYWAWDPVENMSLVPWLTLVAGIHMNLVARNTGYSIRSTYVFYLLTFILILYSTFLTRSGVLGDTSVHAFTEMGLEWQLVTFIGSFLLLSIAALALRYKGIPAPKKEEHVASKEFWMFIGTLMLLFSALIITGSTSLPVYNKIRAFFQPGFQGSVITDPIPHYNKYQIWIAVFMAVLSGGAQYLRFRESNWKKNAGRYFRHIGIGLGVTALLTYLTTLWINTYTWQYTTLLFSGIFVAVTNLDYLITFLRGNLKAGGSVISHFGFGLMIVGIIASGLNQQVISSNPFVMEGLIEGSSAEDMRKNLMLFHDQPMVMDNYTVTYVGDTLDTYTRSFKVNFKRRNEAGEVVEEFNLAPNVLYEKDFKKIAAYNPSTRRYWNKDIFTTLTALPRVEMDFEYKRQKEDSLNYKAYDIPLQQPFTVMDTVVLPQQDTALQRQFTLRVKGVNRNPSHPDYHPKKGDIAIGADLLVQRSDNDSVFQAQPVVVLRDQYVYSYPVQLNEISAKVRLGDRIFERAFAEDSGLDYQTFELKKGESFRLGEQRVRFIGYDKNPQHPNYSAQDGDIAVSTILRVDKGGATYHAEPLYLIRGNRPLNLKDHIQELGLHFRFVNIDPKTETVTIKAAYSDKQMLEVPVELATDSLRSDYIVMQAIEFPGINLFWAGASFMMIGLLFSLWHRLSLRTKAAS